MDNTHFMEWMDFFVQRMLKEGGQPPQERHLVILDGHKSHVNLEVLMKAKENGIDMISLPSHTSHELQPLDKACFKPFKVAFRAYRDLWALKHQGQKCRKEDLAQWASLAFKKALTKKNIMSGFRATGIWPLNPQALQTRTSPSEGFTAENEEEEQRAEIFEEGMPNPGGGGLHYYGTEEEKGLQEVEEGSAPEAECEPPTAATTSGDHISQFLKLPRVPRRAAIQGRPEPLIDYSSSQLLTLEQHLNTLERIVSNKERVQEEKLQKQREREENRAKKAEEKERQKLKKAEEKEARRVAKDQRIAQQGEKRNSKRRGTSSVLTGSLHCDSS